MVQILELELKNYRQYEGINTIDLQTTPEENINIIQGQNGAGKSNILNAITLCFYDEEVHQEATTDDLETLPLISESVLNDLDTGESARGYIEVHLGDETPSYIFRREFETFIVPNGHNDQTEELQLQRRVGNQYEISDEPQTTLNQILPAGVRDYFIFDGEALTEFFEADYKDRVQDGIIDVSHIGVLNSSIDHVQKVRKEIQKKAKNVQGEAADIQGRIEDMEDDLQTLESEKASLETEKSEIKREINRIEERLRGANDDRVKELVDRRDSLRDDIEDLKDERDKHRNKVCNLLLKAGPAVYAGDALEFTLDTIEDLEEKGELPPKIQEWFVNDLIERGECICGREISDGSEMHEHLLELKQRMSEVSTDNIEGKAEIPHLLEDGGEGAERIKELRERIRGVTEKIEQKDSDLGEVKNRLKGTDIPDDLDVGELTQQLESLEDDQETILNEIGQTTARIESKKSDIEQARNQLNQELQKEDRHASIVEQTEFAGEAVRYMREIRETILGEIRRETQNNLNEYFNELIWKDDEYNVSLDDDYSVEVHGPDSSDNMIGSLSAGEKQVLALSFMAALSDISGFTAPIVIDTPLGRISSEPKKLIAQNLPHYLDDTQMTFLMTDEEYSSEVKGRMQHRIANEYKLHYQDGITEVIDYE